LDSGEPRRGHYFRRLRHHPWPNGPFIKANRAQSLSMKKHDDDTLGQLAGAHLTYRRHHFHLLTLNRDRGHEHLPCIKEHRASSPRGQHGSSLEKADTYGSPQVMEANGSIGHSEEIGDTQSFTKRLCQRRCSTGRVHSPGLDKSSASAEDKVMQKRVFSFSATSAFP
jgi:hypothetical protein